MTSIQQDIDAILGEGGKFESALSSFRVREAQLQMAHKVAEAIQYQGCFIAESGTGTGKTFAYLVPAILSGKATIISTATKHLQDQIFFKDLPVVQKALDMHIDCCILKGRSNYLCSHRYKQSLVQKQTYNIETQLHKVREWSQRTKSGDLSEVPDLDETSPAIKLMTSTVDNCLGGQCPDYSKCFVNKARQKALKAKIVVVNHHLFYSDLTLKVDGFGELLPQHETVIFDEAHKIPDIAMRFFSSSVSSHQLNDLSNDISAYQITNKKVLELSQISLSFQQAVRDLSKVLSKNRVSILDHLQLNRLPLEQPVSTVVQLLRRISEVLSEHDDEDLQKFALRAVQQISTLESWLFNEDRDTVKWAETGDDFFRLHLTPVSIRKHSQKMMAENNHSWVFTSATLAVNHDFSSFKNEMGLDEVETACWESPYDFENRSLMYLPTNMCDPRDQNYPNRLLDVIMQVTSLSKGHTFCLFTSYAMMYKVYDKLKHLIRWPLLLQGSKSKSQLIDDFVNTPNAVLLGTASFWEGVDVKGKDLSCVIVDKIPFVSPSDPVYRRKLEMDEENGNNAFMDRQVPDAVITLKQGVGRLMRSEKDYGVMVLCDPRIRTSRYGKVFLQSLPSMPITNNLDHVQQFYRRHN